MMSTSYAEAREIVRRKAGADWSVGTFCLDDREILDNDELYVFRIGAWEHLVGGDRTYAVAGGVPVVYKADGRFDWLPSAAVAMDRTIRSTPNPEPTFRIVE